MVLLPPRPSATKRWTGINGNGGNPPTGTQGKASSSNLGTKKWGRKKACQRASVYQHAKTRTALATRTRNLFGRRIKGLGRNIEAKHTSNNPLRYEDTIEILASRQATTEDITAESVKAHASEQDERTAAEQLDKAETAYVHTVSSTKVPDYGKLRIDEKDSEAIRFMSQNVNSMSYWLRDNYKAEQLKFLLKQYNINTAGFQEVCINWAALKPSQTMVSLLRHKESLRSVHSYNA